VTFCTRALIILIGPHCFHTSVPGLPQLPGSP
jgi:hypothetical protein